MPDPLATYPDGIRLHPAAGPTPSAPAHTTPLPTRSVGRFRVEREIGRGGMGVVLLARDPALGRPVAVKLMRFDDPVLRARFAVEAVLVYEEVLEALRGKAAPPFARPEALRKAMGDARREAGM